MITQQTLHGNWNEFKEKLRSKWASLTDDDLKTFDGNVDQLVGTIQRKTGEAREGIEEYVKQLSSDSDSAMSRTGKTVRAFVQQAAETVQETSMQAAESVRDGYAEVEDMVRQRPAESLAVCFGVGVVTGVVVSLLIRWR